MKLFNVNFFILLLLSALGPNVLHISMFPDTVDSIER